MLFLYIYIGVILINPLTTFVPLLQKYFTINLIKLYNLYFQIEVRNSLSYW